LNFYSGIAKRIAASGYGVYAMDYPGFGLSDGLHGYIPDFDDLVDDVIEHYSKIKGKIFCIHDVILITIVICNLSYGKMHALYFN